MSYYFGSQEPSFTDIYHHGILGQKWGVRRYQNEDGTLTEEGRKRYGNADKVYSHKEQAAFREDWVSTQASCRDHFKNDPRASSGSSKDEYELEKSIRNYMFENSKIIKQFVKDSEKDYELRNKIYNGEVNANDYLPDGSFWKTDKPIYGGEEAVYGYGKIFKDLIENKLKNITGDKHITDLIMDDIMEIDMSDKDSMPKNMKQFYNDYSWLYWH